MTQSTKNTYLFLIYQLFGGGAERVTSILASSLAEQGHDVYIGTYKRTSKDYPVSDKVHVRILNAELGRSKIGKSISRIRQVSNLIREVHPDFTIGMMGSVLVEGRIASFGHRTCYISAIRNDPAQVTSSRIARVVFLVANMFSDAVFVQNQTQKEYFPKWMHKRIFEVFNPVADSYITAFRAKTQTIRNIMMSGRLVEQKNHKLIIDAIAHLHNDYPDLKLSIYGDGPLKETMQGYIDAHGLTNNVRLEGRTNDVLGKLVEHDMFILSSNHEGMPNALLEAMAVGLPCISTDCRTGPSDMIRDHESGLLVPVDDLPGMVEAIRYMVEHPDDAFSMGIRAKRFAKNNCSVDIVVRRFVRECNKFHR